MNWKDAGIPDHNAMIVLFTAAMMTVLGIVLGLHNIAYWLGS